MNVEDYGIDEALVAEYARACAEKEAAEQAMSNVVLASVNLKKGDVVEDTSNGLHYTLDYCSVHFNGRKVGISVAGKRTWKSGRKAGRTAYTSSFLSLSDLKKVEE